MRYYLLLVKLVKVRIAIIREKSSWRKQARKLVKANPGCPDCAAYANVLMSTEKKRPSLSRQMQLMRAAASHAGSIPVPPWLAAYCQGKNETVSCTEFRFGDSDDRADSDARRKRVRSSERIPKPVAAAASAE